MRILFLCGEYGLAAGGIRSYVRTVGPALVRRGHEVHVLSCLADQPEDDSVEEGVHVHRRGKRSIRGVARLTGGFAAHDRLEAALSCRAEYAALGIEADVVEAPDWGAEGLFVTRVPIVATLHTPRRLVVDAAGRDGLLADRLERAAVRRAAALTAPTRLVADRLRRWVGGRPVEVIPHPLDSGPWSAAPAADATDAVVLAVGRIDHVKGADVLAEAAEQLGGAEVVLVGRSTDRGFRDRLGRRCRLVEEVAGDELRAWYARARVVAVPSRWDSGPITALEAMACGRPVVISSNAGLADTVAEARAGSVLAPEDPSALAAALEPYLADAHLAAEHGARGLDYVASVHAPDRVASAREACYERVVKAVRRRSARPSTGLGGATR